MLTIDGDRDRADARRACCASTRLLPAFFEPEHQRVRYT